MRFSDKIGNIEESFLNRWDSVIKGRIAAGEDILQFNLGQPDFAVPDFVQAAISKVQGVPGNNFYNHTGGTDGARRGVAKLEEKLTGLQHDQEEVVITNGAKEAIFLALSALLKAGDEVIVIAPAWPTYIEAVKFLGGKPVVLDAAADFHLDLAAIRGAVNDRTRAIILNSPHNPTGVIYAAAELEEVSRIAIAADLCVISDEVYNSTVFDGKEHFSIAQLPGMKERTVVIDGFSKTLSMTGYRLGYAASSREMVDAMIKVKSNINGNTNSFFQMVLEEVIDHHPDELWGFVERTRSEYQSRRDFLHAGLQALGIEHLLPAGTFYVWARIPERVNMKSREFCEYLLSQAGVALAPGIFFGKSYDDYFRISFGAAREDLEEGLERMKKML